MPRHHLASLAVACLAVLGVACATPVRAQSQPATPSVETVLATRHTVLGQPIAYPTASPAKVEAAIVTLPPGASTGWHRHEVPLFGYMLEGELTVDYRGAGQRIYRPGDGLIEAIDTVHDGRNAGAVPVRILVVFMGADGVSNTEMVE